MVVAGAARADHPTGSYGASAAGPIVTVPADTLPAGAAAFGIRTTFLRVDAFPDARLARLAGEQVHAHSTDRLYQAAVGVSYGVTDRFTLSADLPYVRREDMRAASHDHVEGGGEENTAVSLGDAGGIGDLTVLGAYRLLGGAGGASLAGLFGIKTPTGETGRPGDDGERLDAGQQPGSGSWDPLLGAAVSWRHGAASLDANVLYRNAGEGALETDLGDRLLYNLALSWRIAGAAAGATDGAHHEHGQHDHGHGNDARPAWDLILELNGERQEEETIAGERHEDTASHVIFLSPGLRLTGGSGWSAYLSVGMPVYEDVERGHPGPDFRVMAGTGWSY